MVIIILILLSFLSDNLLIFGLQELVNTLSHDDETNVYDILLLGFTLYKP